MRRDQIRIAGIAILVLAIAVISGWWVGFFGAGDM
jgi:hypothetical protein